jgi:hypothetical protein
MTSLLQDLLQDIRYGVRTLAKNPAFALVAVLTLALGIGANTAIFTVVNGILLRPLHFKDSARLVLLQESLPPIISQLIPVSAPDVIDFRKQNQVFEDLGAVQNVPFSLSGSGLPEHVRAARVSAQMFPILGISPLALGLTRLMTTLIYDVAPTDPITYGAVAALLAAVALLACYLPARRAMRLDPMVALRYE